MLRGPAFSQFLVCLLPMQEDLIRSYNLPFEVVGQDSELRMRIHPLGFVSGDVERRMGEEWAPASSWHTA